MDLNKDVVEGLQGQPVLVTGAAGFIGSHLTEALLELGADVHIIVRPSSRPIQNLEPRAIERLSIHWADLADPVATRLAVSDFGRAIDRPCYVFHLAAQAHVGESWTRPIETFNSNIFGTFNLLQAIVEERLDVTKLDVAGTSEEYGNVNEAQRSAYTFRDDGAVVFNERSPLNPQSPYATSKMASDFLGMNFFEGYGLPVVTTRMFNNFGPRQNPRYFTPTIITQALVRDKVLMGEPKATRDYTFVKDGVRGHLYAAVAGEPGRAFTFGHGDDVGNLAWATQIVEVGKAMGQWGEKEIVVDPSRFRPGTSEIQRLGVDYSNFEAATGWRPSFARDDAIAQTIEYYARHQQELIAQHDW